MNAPLGRVDGSKDVVRMFPMMNSGLLVSLQVMTSLDSHTKAKRSNIQAVRTSRAQSEPKRKVRHRITRTAYLPGENEHISIEHRRGHPTHAADVPPEKKFGPSQPCYVGRAAGDVFAVSECFSPQSTADGRQEEFIEGSDGMAEVEHIDRVKVFENLYLGV